MSYKYQDAGGKWRVTIPVSEGGSSALYFPWSVSSVGIDTNNQWGARLPVV